MVAVASRSVPGRFYEVVDGRCTCTAASFGRKCRHVAAAEHMADAEQAIGERYREMTQEPGPLAHKDIHAALAAIYREVGYVQKSGRMSGTATYTFAGEADLIHAIRPSMVDHEVYMHVTQVLNRDHDTFTNKNGTLMHHVRLDVMVRFAHGPSGTFIDCMASGEGIDSGDKATPKALTGAFKYAIRQTFCIETGDDPDGTPSTEQERTYGEKTGASRVYPGPNGLGDPLPPFPTPRGTVDDEWQKVGAAISAGEVNRRALAEVFGGTFNLPAFDAYLKGHAGRDAGTAIAKAKQLAAVN